MDAQFKLMREYMGDDIVKWMLIPIELHQYLKSNPIKPKEDIENNPHSNIIHICNLISNKIVEEGFECTVEEVMHCWLTIAVYHNDLI